MNRPSGKKRKAIAARRALKKLARVEARWTRSLAVDAVVALGATCDLCGESLGTHYVVPPHCPVRP